jgi:hypothetical protein
MDSDIMKIFIVAMSLMLFMVIRAYSSETIVCKMDRSGMVDASCQKGDILLRPPSQGSGITSAPCSQNRT